jgi:hypothetical protein
VPNPGAGTIWASLREGIAYVFSTRIILYAISLDMFSVLFGGVVALLPVFAEDILAVGPQGLGLLRAAPAIGALLTVIFCAYHPPLNRPCRVQSVNSIFISSSNELGAFESGLAAKLLGTVPSVIAGAAVTCGVVAWMWRRSGALFAVKM